ncbi:MAG: leucyl aminopeptidase [Pirellulales bacterium]
MQVVSTDLPASQLDADAVVVPVFADQPFSGATAEIDRATGGALTRLRDARELTGKVLELTAVLAPAGVKAPQVLVIGLGDPAKVDRGVAFRAASAAAKQLAGKSRRRVGFYLSEGLRADIVESAICGAMSGCQGQDLYRAEKKRHPFGELVWSGADDATLHSGRVIGESILLTRRLVNEPPNEMYPEAFAVVAARVAEECQLESEIWDRERLAAERCAALLAVGRASSRPPRLVILKYQGAASSDAPWLALVGKGVTFDSGGLSLKPSDSMKTMKCDMAGAATVLGAIRAIARLKLPVNVIALCGLVENMIGGDAYKLGDVIKARNGRTIEILNTDAEGRVVLADVLDVAVERGASQIVDLATLTGACVVALGTDVAGAMANDQSWCDAVLTAARTCGEPLWQLPMWPEYNEHIKSEVADIRNIGDGRWGGAIAGAKFLEEFVAGKPWTHLDIAGPAFFDAPKPWLDAGASGLFVRTLVEIARNE